MKCKCKQFISILLAMIMVFQFLINIEYIYGYTIENIEIPEEANEYAYSNYK